MEPMLPLLEQELGQVAAVLAGDAGDEGLFQFLFPESLTSIFIRARSCPRTARCRPRPGGNGASPLTANCQSAIRSSRWISIHACTRRDLPKEILPDRSAPSRIENEASAPWYRALVSRVGHGFLDRSTLACHVDVRTKRNITVAFALDDDCQLSVHGHPGISSTNDTGSSGRMTPDFEVASMAWYTQGLLER